jgi:hypothetical protein
MLTHELLKQYLHYDPLTGVFTRRAPKNKKSRVKEGEIAGTINQGRNKIWVHDRRYLASVLAWFYMTGEMPTQQVDHEDRNTLNDRWANLRAATNKQNQENVSLRKDNTSGYRGVWWRAEVGKWKAMIRHNGHLKALGYFAKKTEAIAARRAAEQQLFTHAK